MTGFHGKLFGLALAFCAALFLAGCGSDAPPAESGTTPAETPVSETGDDATAPAGETPQDPASGPELNPPSTDGASTVPAPGPGTAAVSPVLQQQRAFDADPFAVPDGTPDELLTYLLRLRQVQPADVSSRAALDEHFAKLTAAFHEATDKIIAASPDEDDLAEAIAWKYAAFNAQSEQLGDPDADALATEFLNKWKDDEHPSVAQQVSALIFQRSVQPVLRNIIDNWDSMDEAGRQATLDELAAIFEEVEPSEPVARELMTIVSYLSSMDGTDVTVSFLESQLPRFEAASDPGVAVLIEPMKKTLRLLNLPGEKMELEGTLLGGAPLDWESYRGKVVLVDFWATWCQPCIVELPNVLRNYQAYHDQGLEVLGVSLDMHNEHDQVTNFIERFGIPWKTIVGETPETSFWDHPMADKFGVGSIPRAILVDEEGVVVSISARGERLGEQLRELLGEPAVEVTESAVPAVPQASAAESPVPEVAQAVAPE